MASTEDSRRASIASSSEMSFADSTTAGKVLPKKEKPTGTGGVKLKKSIAKKTKPKDTESNGIKTAGPTRSPSPSSPVVDGNATKADNQPPDTTQCKHCKKPVGNAQFESHTEVCLEKKRLNAKKKKEAKEARAKAQEEEKKEKEKQKDKDKDKDKDKEKDRDSTNADKNQVNGTGDSKATTGESTTKATTDSTTKKPPPKKTAPKAEENTTTSTTKKTKKRKAEEAGEEEKEPKKKKQKKDTAAASATGAGTPNPEPPKPKATKPKGPVNVELQCGVALPAGGYCARSLTCKSHSMGAKRSVPGRSAPYDTLLQQYQKKNQAKQQKALLASHAAAVAEADGAEGDGEGATIDSDEEREGVMKGIARGWGGRPLEKIIAVPTIRRYKAVRIREMVQGALAGGRLFAGASGGGGGSAVQPSPITAGGADGADGESSSVRRGSMIGNAGSTSGGGIGKGGSGPARKASVASVGGA